MFLSTDAYTVEQADGILPISILRPRLALSPPCETVRRLDVNFGTVFVFCGLTPRSCCGPLEIALHIGIGWTTELFRE